MSLPVGVMEELKYYVTFLAHVSTHKNTKYMYKVYNTDSSLNTAKFFISYWWNSAINYMFRPT
jgi:hypothetical protein